MKSLLFIVTCFFATTAFAENSPSQDKANAKFSSTTTVDTGVSYKIRIFNNSNSSTLYKGKSALAVIEACAEDHFYSDCERNVISVRHNSTSNGAKNRGGGLGDR